jgi:hypothetical protein
MFPLGAWKVVCWPMPAAAVPGGRWIPYSATQVALRRAARLVCVVVGFDVGGAALAPPALPLREHVPTAFGVSPPAYNYPPVEFFVPGEFPPETFAGAPQGSVPHFEQLGPNTDLPEPVPIFILIVALGVLVAINEGRRHTMNNRTRDWPEGPRHIEPLTEDDEDSLAPGRGLVFGVLLGTAFWIAVAIVVLTFLPAWSWGLL